MASYPIEIRRCRHIRTNGTQCGSPALREKEFCYYHEQNQPRAVELYVDGDRYPDSEFMLPVFEDAHSIQTALRQVIQLLFEHRIHHKDAGLMLYALQIASGNLKRMEAEKAKPTQMVVDPAKAGETPLGMTPWSASGQGHDPDEDDSDQSSAPSPFGSGQAKSSHQPSGKPERNAGQDPEEDGDERRSAAPQVANVARAGAPVPTAFSPQPSAFSRQEQLDQNAGPGDAADKKRQPNRGTREEGRHEARRAK